MSLRDFFDYFNYRRLKRHDKFYLRKRSLFLIFGLLLILYLLSTIFNRFNFKKFQNDDLTTECINKFLQSYHQEILSKDSSIWIPPNSINQLNDLHNVHGDSHQEQSSSSSKSFIPLVGNGRFSISPIQQDIGGDGDESNRFYIRGKRILNIPIMFDPIVNFQQFGYKTKSAYILRYLHGSYEKVTCSNYGGNGVVRIHEIFTAHRLIPVLFTQDIRITNPTNAPLILNLSRKGWLSKSILSPSKSINVQTKDHREYSILVARSQSKAQAIAIAYSSIHDSIEIHPNDQQSLVIHTFINYTTTYPSDTEMLAAIPELKISLREAVQKIVDFSDIALKQYHQWAWENLWSSGFQIQHSHAPNVVNGEQINATIYYLLSQRPMLLSSTKPSSENNNFLNNLSTELFNLIEFESTNLNSSSGTSSGLYKPDRCYHGHSTFHASRLWDPLDSINNLQRVISIWFLTLEKLSCENLIKSNAKEVLQAIILSLAGLRFTKKHLEFHSNPSDLQRTFLIRRLWYFDDNSADQHRTSINISVVINEENKAVIQVALDQQNPLKDFYACDAGCLDPPIHLTRSWQEFPVKLTEPLTPLLYITSDREHLQELKHTIHVKEISLAPAHEHQTIAIHRYGHSLGGLPQFFWIAMIFLILVFHLFLGKLIYNEYFNPTTQQQNERTSYRNIGRYSM